MLCPGSGPCSLRFPVLCKAQLQDWLEFMMPSLQGGVGDFPPWLRPLHERGHDLTFLGCAARLLWGLDQNPLVPFLGCAAMLEGGLVQNPALTFPGLRSPAFRGF